MSVIEKITDVQLEAVGVTTLADAPEITATELKAKFEETSRDLIAPKVNEIIDELNNVPDSVDGKISAHNSSESAHSDIRTEVSSKVTSLEVAAQISTHDGSSTAHSSIRAAVAEKYTKPVGGIPDTDLDSDVQTSLGKANTAYQLPSGGVPKADLATAVQTSLGKADTAYQKPSGGIPYNDLAPAIQDAVDATDYCLMPANIDSTLARQGNYVAPSKKVGDLFNQIYDMLSPLYVPANTWAEIQQIVRQGLASKIFHVGDQLVCTKDDTNLVWDIIGIDHDTPADSQYTHSMTLQLHSCWTDAMQFAAQEAFYYCDSRLTAGTYYFKIDSSYEPSNNTYSGYQFTLAQAVPIDGQLCLVWNNGSAGNIKISSFSSATATSAIESNLSVTNGTSGTFLGTITNSVNIDNNLNAITRARFGNNNYKISAIRQWLNSSAAAGSVWQPQGLFDTPPSWAGNTKGWMNGIDADFLAVIGETAITAVMPWFDGGGTDILNDKFFLLSRDNVYAKTQDDPSEGGAYPFYSEYSSLPEAGTGADSNRIKYKESSVSAWLLRTPHSSGNNVLAISNTGALSSAGARGSSALSIACNII